MILNDVTAVILRYSAEFGTHLKANYTSSWLQLDQHCLLQKGSLTQSLVQRIQP